MFDKLTEQQRSTVYTSALILFRKDKFHIQSALCKVVFVKRPCDRKCQILSETKRSIPRCVVVFKWSLFMIACEVLPEKKIRKIYNKKIKK